jgi:hypothetical protein
MILFNTRQDEFGATGDEYAVALRETCPFQETEQ